jgi:hypothetical protein
LIDEWGIFLEDLNGNYYAPTSSKTSKPNKPTIITHAPNEITGWTCWDLL